MSCSGANYLDFGFSFLWQASFATGCAYLRELRGPLQLLAHRMPSPSTVPMEVPKAVGVCQVHINILRT